MSDSTRLIPLTQGLYAIVDEADYEWLSQFKWHAAKMGRAWYAMRKRKSHEDGKRRIYMHRFIMNTPDGMDTDHINGAGLDNRRSNLRICTHSENLRNRSVQSNNTSGYKGVYWNKAVSKWQAYIWADKTSIYLGLHPTAEEAALAYNKAAIKLHGEFARLNEMPEEDMQSTSYT